MSVKSISAAIIVCAGCVLLFADTIPSYLKPVIQRTPVLFNNNIGAAAGFISGYGVSYRRTLSEKSSLQITGIPFYLESKYTSQSLSDFNQRDSGYSHIGNLSLGVMYNHILAQEMELRVLSYCGGNLNVQYENSNYRERSENFNDITGNYDTTITRVVADQINNLITLGGGFGGELQLWRLTGTVMLGLRAYYNINTKEKGIMPSAEVSVLFGY
jgi:hypothetical protein